MNKAVVLLVVVVVIMIALNAYVIYQLTELQKASDELLPKANTFIDSAQRNLTKIENLLHL